MATWLRQSTAVDIKLGPFVDDADGFTTMTGLTISQADVRLAKNNGNWAQKNDANSATHEENGWYEVPLNTTDTDTLGILIVAVNESGALPVWREFLVVTANVWDTWFSTDTLDVNVTSMAAGTVTASAIATGAIDADAIAADAVAEIRSVVSGTADSGSTTTMVDAARTEADTDYWKGDIILFTSGNISGQARLITGFTPGTDTITFAPATTQAVGTNTYEILPAARADLQLWLGSVVNALVSGRVDSSTGAMAAGVVTASAVATGAIDADALATDAVDEIVDAVWNEDATGHQTQGTFGQVIGDSGADTDTIWSLANTNLDAAVSSRLAPTTAGRTLDVTATGAAGVDWGNVENQSTAVNLSATNIDVDQVVASVSGAVGSVTGAVGSVTGNVGGNVVGSVGSVAAGGITASSIATGAIDADAVASDAVTEIRSVASGTADSGSTTTMVDSARTEADTDYWKGDFILFTSGNISGQCRLITAFDPATDTITFAPAATQAVGTNTYEILPSGRVDVQLWLGSLVNVLISGRVDSNVGAMQNDTVTAAAIATDAIGSAELAASAVTEIQSSILSDATPFQGARIDASISSRATPAQVNTEVLDVLTVDTFSEPSAVVAATATIKDMLNWLKALARNKVTMTSTTQTLRNDADAGNIATSTQSDDGTTYTRGEWS